MFEKVSYKVSYLTVLSHVVFKSIIQSIILFLPTPYRGEVAFRTLFVEGDDEGHC